MRLLYKILLIFIAIIFVNNYSYAQVNNTYIKDKLSKSQIGNIIFEYQYDALGNRTFYKVSQKEIQIIDLQILPNGQTQYINKDIINELPVSILNTEQSSAGGFYINTYLSEDILFNASDIFLTKKFMPNISGNNQIETFISLHIPENFTEESAFLILKIDPTNLIVETIETNNEVNIPIIIVEYTNSESEVQFTADAQFGCSGTEVQFTDLTPNNSFEWNWVFPGGSPSASKEQNPKVIYYTEGVFPVSLNVVNDNGTFSKREENLVNISNNPLVTFEGIPDILSHAGGEFTINIRNECGTTLNWYAQLTGPESDWLYISSDMSGTEPGFVTLKYDASNGFPRTASLLISAQDVKNGEQLIELIQGTELNNIQQMRFNKGWNLVSLYVNPDEKNTSEIFSPLVSLLEEIRSFSGNIYEPDNPGSDFEINYKEAFWVKVNENTIMSVTGTLVDPLSESIPLKAGQNWVSFFGQPKTVHKALQSIQDKLVQVKTELDNYAPGYSILNSMDLMIPGKGYLIEVTEDVTLDYPIDQ